MTSSAIRLSVALPLVLLLTLVACDASSSAARGNTSSPSALTGGYLGSLGNPGCAPAAPFHGWKTLDGLPEAGVDSKRGSFWALFFNPVPPPSGKEIKVVWRMTGSGEFAFRVSDAAGATVPLVWGPESHSGSNWDRPGDEVGTGFSFPHAGCWEIHVARSDSQGDLWLEVTA